MQLRTPEAPASYRQTWYLFTLTKRDHRGENLTMAEASQLIKQALTAPKSDNTQPSTPNVSQPKAKIKVSKPKLVKVLTMNGFT